MPVTVLPKQASHEYRDTKTAEERKFYSSKRWTETSRRHREHEPLCRRCSERGKVTAGEMTDHILAMRDGGDPWDDMNLQTLCNQCHNAKRQGERRRR